MNPQKLAVVLFLSFTLSGCSSKLATHQNQQAPVEFTQTPLVATKISLTRSSQVESNDMCTSLSTHGAAEQGYLILENPYQNKKNSMLDLSTMAFKDFSSNHSNVIVSPQGNAIAYLDFINDHGVLSIKDQRGTIKPTISQDIKFIEWVNDHTLAIKENYQPDSFTSFLDIPSGKLVSVPTNFPDLMSDANQFYDIWGRDIPSFDPFMKFAVYPQQNGISLSKVGDKLPIIIVQTSPFRFYPAWSPGGDSFVVSSLSMGGELVRVFTDGEVVVLTDFAAKYSDFNIHSYSWSPDAKRIAFWIDTKSVGGKEISRLAIITLANGKVVLTCLESGYFTYPASNRPIWSLDSKELAVQIFSSDKSNSIYLIDATGLNSSILGKTNHFVPEGWVSLPLFP